MRALAWHGKKDVRVDTVDDPQIINPRDAVIRITSTAICGSDLHLYNALIPTLKPGDVLGHEFMGEVVETGPGSSLAKGDRVVVPFVIACGSCFHCGKQQYSACDNSNPADKADISETLYGYQMSGLFGYSHMTGGIGPDAVIDAVGMESHGFALDSVYDGVKQALMLETDRPHALRDALRACRKGGRVSIPGVYGGFVDKFPIGALMQKGLTVKTGQTHVQKYLPKLLEMIEEKKVDTTFLISHKMSLEEAPEGYRLFATEQNTTTKVVLKPEWEKGRVETLQ